MSVKINKRSTTYIDQLTWLRGLAAFFVIVSHTVRATEVQYSSADEVSSFFLMSLFDLGSFGVMLFFVLSGCTLYISNSGKVGHKDIVAFYLKRFFRIYPAFIVSLVFYVLFSFIFVAFYANPQGYWIEKQFLHSYSIYDLFSYITFIFNITGPSGLFNNAYWSLPIEFQYYIIFPVIVALLKYVGVVGPIGLSLFLYFVPNLGVTNFSDSAVFYFAFSFCGGVLIGYIYKKTSFRINSIFGLFLLAALVFLASAIDHFIPLPDIPIISGKWNWFGGIAMVSVFVVLITKINLHNTIASFLKHYGTISYSTYLYHNLFVATAILFITNFEIYDSRLRLLITFIFTLSTTYMVATVSYKYVEKPSMVTAKNIIKKYGAVLTK